MFVQVISGFVADAEGLRRQFERRVDDLRPGRSGRLDPRSRCRTTPRCWTGSWVSPAAIPAGNCQILLDLALGAG
ncbi:MAG: hypothetical protein LC799_24985, partial [Actinobacteria bacterium]|nr:hypothetical protein [Actinomycetota bacterium]